MKLRSILQVLVPLMLVPGAVAAAPQTFTPELMLENQDVGEARFSPDGSRLYLDKLLAYKNKQHFDWDRDWGRALSVLSEFDTTTGKGVPFSKSPQDRTWYLASSPGGTYVAFGWLNGSVQRVGIRKVANGKEQRLSLAGTSSALPLVWISDSQFVTQSMGQEVQNLTMANGSYSARKIAAWAQEGWDGGTSVKVVGAGRYKSKPNERIVELAVVDAGTGKIQMIDKGTLAMTMQAAPGGGRVAYLRKAGSFDMTGIKLEAMSGAESMDELVLYDRQQGKQVVKLCGGCAVNDGSLRWSPSGDQLYYATRARVKDSFDYRHFFYNTKTGKSVEFQPQGLDWDTEIERSRFVSPIVWLDENRLALRTRDKRAGQFDNQDFQWHLATTEGKVLRTLSSDLSRGKDKEALKFPLGVHKGALLLVADGKLWRVPQEGKPADLTSRLTPEVDSWCMAYATWRMATPRCDAMISDPILPTFSQAVLDKDQIVLRKMKDGVFAGEFLFLDLANGQSTTLIRPSEDSEPLEVSTLGKAALFQRKGTDGDEVLLVRPGGKSTSLYKFNTHLAGIREATPILLNRREAGEDEDRNDWLLLPPDHKPGQRHPLLVYFYPDTRYKKELKGDDLRDISFLNKNIPTAHGYAVLMASMKISDYGKGKGNPMREMHEQLIRAAENAVAKGYVDPERWAIMGHSYGGYGTNSVITQTNRFKAAVSLDGPSNLTSGYAIGMNQDKAYAVPEGLNFGALWSEGGQGRMGVAPWTDPQRYIDNSPFFWAHQITTPLMLIHGDQDFVNVNEAEQLFAALQRQGKDVELVRYWGEGHVYASPGNIMDMWDRIFAFLDQNLNQLGAQTSAGSAGSARGAQPVQTSR